MELKEGKHYIIGVETKFDGQFKGLVVENEVTYAIFQQPGRTDRGSIPMRKVPVSNITSSELVKY